MSARGERAMVSPAASRTGTGGMCTAAAKLHRLVLSPLVVRPKVRHYRTELIRWTVVGIISTYRLLFWQVSLGLRDCICPVILSLHPPCLLTGGNRAQKFFP
jgi:hypothetical protein